MAEVPEFELVMRELQGIQPLIQLEDDIWEHGGKCGEACACLLTAERKAFVHCLIPPPISSTLIPKSGSTAVMEWQGVFHFDDCGYLGVGRPGINTICCYEAGRIRSIVIISIRTMEVGLLIHSDWIRPVTRGAWRAVQSGTRRRTGPNGRSGRG